MVDFSITGQGLGDLLELGDKHQDTVWRDALPRAEFLEFQLDVTRSRTPSPTPTMTSSSIRSVQSRVIVVASRFGSKARRFRSIVRAF